MLAPPWDTVLADDPDAAHSLDIVASDRADVYRTQTSRAYNCGSSDDTIAFALSDDRGAPQALVETDDARVQEWFTSFFQTVRQDATRITVDDLPV